MAELLFAQNVSMLGSYIARPNGVTTACFTQRNVAEDACFVAVERTRLTVALDIRPCRLEIPEGYRLALPETDRPALRSPLERPGLIGVALVAKRRQIHRAILSID
ncbi:hypothetical protein KPG66_12835 [Mycetohabitans sp. B2]|nr:hypothetical protein [Mycetohabitans sp. B2]MCG1048476.1 hypothetical protein [Mycetohabitans sp. B6]